MLKSPMGHVLCPQAELLVKQDSGRQRSADTSGGDLGHQAPASAFPEEDSPPKSPKPWARQASRWAAWCQAADLGPLHITTLRLA